MKVIEYLCDSCGLATTEADRITIPVTVNEDDNKHIHVKCLEINISEVCMSQNVEIAKTFRKLLLTGQL